ncbi:Ldh family oxidoreductase [Cupriavidus taiwanensis]|uniref:Ldh family oxidoreductase n=1 Tax=Cupriavidus taiwanensis TaxID=164546 RepID=UPI0039C39DCD
MRLSLTQDQDNLGSFFCAIDPGALRDPAEFRDDMDELIDVPHAAPPVDPASPVLVHGEAHRERARPRLIGLQANCHISERR